MDCPFCHPKIHQAVFLSNEVALAIYNIAPVLPGHSLIIPRKHFSSLLELDPAEYIQYLELARRATVLLNQAFHTDAFNWSLQEHLPAGQTISHLHLHILPRILGDLPEPGDWYPALQQGFYDEEHLDSSLRPRINDADMQQIIAHLRSHS